MILNLSTVLNSVLNESVSQNEVSDAISNQQYVQLNYVDDDGAAVGNRLVQPYVLGRSMAGNPVVRVFQVSGDSLRKRSWKTLRLDRIISWKPRKQTFHVPPQYMGYNIPAYNQNGDRAMSVIYNQVKFNDQDDTLGVERAKTQNIKNAPKISSKQKMGPIGLANQQWKKNVYTSQPNSQKYASFRKNIEDTENEINRFDDDIWAQAEAEKNRQDSERILNTAPQPIKNNEGPIVDNLDNDGKRY